MRAWFDTTDSSLIFVSVLTLGEIRRGAERLLRRDPAQAAAYLTWLDGLKTQYAEHVVPITLQVAEEWGRLSAPQLLPAVDGLLAATALVHGLTVVTRNTADFQRAGVSLLNPFTN